MSICPGCNVDLPATELVPEGRLNASPECWQVHGEVVGFELNHLSLLGKYHQRTVDAYGAQHSGGDAPVIGIAYSLVGLHLALERGLDGSAVRAVHQRLGKPTRSWPVFGRPDDVGELTVLDVAEAGARADSVEGHAEAIERWASAVWQAWSDHHAAVAALTDRVLGTGPVSSH